MGKLTLGLCALIFSSASLLIQIFAVVFPYWAVSTDSSGSEDSYGLWQRCSRWDGRRSCYELVVPDFMQGVRTVEVLGILSLALAIACWCLKRFVWTTQKKLLKAGGILSLSAGAFITTGIIIFGVKLNAATDGVCFTESKCRFHAAFGLCVAAGALAIASGIVFFKWEKRAGEEDEDDVALINVS